jgi:hypothetical protein
LPLKGKLSSTGVPLKDKLNMSSVKREVELSSAGATLKRYAKFNKFLAKLNRSSLKRVS